MIFDDISLKVYKSNDYSKSMLWVPKLLFDVLLMWPDTKKRLLSTIACCVFTISNFIVMAGLIFYLKLNIHNFNKTSFAMCLLGVPMLSLLKLPVIWYKTRELEHLLNEIKTNFWPYYVVDGETKTFLIKFYKYMCIYMISFFMLGLTVLTTILFTGQMYMLPILILPFFVSERVLPFPCELPFAWKYSPTYEILFSIQLIALELAVAIGVVAVDLFIIAVCEGAANQYRILQNCFLAFNTDEMIKINDELRKIDKGIAGKYDIQREYFIRCVKHHDFLLRFTKKMNAALNPLELGQFLISVFGICLGIFILSRPGAPTLQYVSILTYIVGFLFQVGVECGIGTDLYYQAMLVPECLFKSNWAALESNAFKKDVMFVMQHCQRYPQFSAYGLYDLNMNSFAKVLKLSLSIYTLLKNMANK